MSQQNNEDELIKQNIGLVKKIVTIFNPQDKDSYEEYYSIGLVGLLMAIRTLDHTKGQLSTLVWSIVYRSILNYVKKEKKHPHLSISNIPCYVYGDNILEYLPDSLTNIEKSIINLRLQGFTLNEIDRKYNKNTGWASNRYYDILKKIKEAND